MNRVFILLYLTNKLSWIWIVLAQWNNNSAQKYYPDTEITSLCNMSIRDSIVFQKAINLTYKHFLMIKEYPITAQNKIQTWYLLQLYLEFLWSHNFLSWVNVYLPVLHTQHGILTAHLVTVSNAGMCKYKFSILS